MSVRDIMTTDLITAASGANLQEAVTSMLDERVGSVVIAENGEPVGIVTETDVLAVGTAFENPFSEIPVSRAMSADPVTIAPDASLEEAIETMQKYGIKKLPVVDDGGLVGIVTLTDLVYHRHELVQEAKELERQQSAVDRASR
jgi:CBS domain-containing protein